MLLAILEEGLFFFYFIFTILDILAKLEEKTGLPVYCKLIKDNSFKLQNNAYYGPTCGFDFLIDFKGFLVAIHSKKIFNYFFR